MSDFGSGVCGGVPADIVNRCKTCKWWGALESWQEPDEEPPNQYPCAQHKNCAHPKVGGDFHGSESRNGPDALCTYESVGTGPEFGCIHWEAA